MVQFVFCHSPTAVCDDAAPHQRVMSAGVLHRLLRERAADADQLLTCHQVFDSEAVGSLVAEVATLKQQLGEMATQIDALWNCCAQGQC